MQYTSALRGNNTEKKNNEKCINEYKIIDLLCLRYILHRGKIKTRRDFLKRRI